MRAVRFTKAETELIRRCVEGYLSPVTEVKRTDLRAMSSLLDKLAAAEAPKVAGVNAAAFEAALIGASHGKIVPVESNSYPRVSRQATQAGATVELAPLVGSWIASQSWLRGPLTVFTVLNKWPDWLARAKVTAPPDGLEEGLNAVGSLPAKATVKRSPGLGTARSEKTTNRS